MDSAKDDDKMVGIRRSTRKKTPILNKTTIAKVKPILKRSNISFSKIISGDSKLLAESNKNIVPAERKNINVENKNIVQVEGENVETDKIKNVFQAGENVETTESKKDEITKIKNVIQAERVNVVQLECTNEKDPFEDQSSTSIKESKNIPDVSSQDNTPLVDSCEGNEWKDINLEDFTVISEATENTSDSETIGGTIDSKTTNRLRKKIEWDGPSVVNRGNGIVEIYGSKLPNDARYSKIVLIGDSYLNDLYLNWPSESVFRPYFIWKKMITVRDMSGIIKYHSFLKKCDNALVILCLGNTDITEFAGFKKCSQPHPKICLPATLKKRAAIVKRLRILSDEIRELHPMCHFAFANLPALNFVLNVDTIMLKIHKQWKKCSCRYTVSKHIQEKYDNDVNCINQHIFNKRLSQIDASCHFCFTGLEVLFDESEWKLPKSLMIPLAVQLHNRLTAVILPAGKLINSQISLFHEPGTLYGVPIYILGDLWLQNVSSNWDFFFSYLCPQFYPCANFNFAALKEFILSAILPDEPCLIVTSIGAEYFLSYKEHDCKDHLPLKYPVPNPNLGTELREQILNGMKDISRVLETRKNCRLFYMTCYPISFTGYLNFLRIKHGNKYNKCIKAPLMSKAECISAWETMKVNMSVIDKIIVNYNSQHGSHTCDIGLLLRTLIPPNENLFPTYIEGMCIPQMATSKLLILVKEYLHSIAKLVEQRQVVFNNSNDKFAIAQTGQHTFNVYEDIVVTIKNDESLASTAEDDMVDVSVKSKEEIDIPSNVGNMPSEGGYEEDQLKGSTTAKDSFAITEGNEDNLSEFDLQVISECSESELLSNHASNFSDVSSVGAHVDEISFNVGPEKRGESISSDDTINSATIIAMDAESISSGDNLPENDTVSISSDEDPLSKKVSLHSNDMEAISSEEGTVDKTSVNLDDMESISSEEGTIAKKATGNPDEMELISSADSNHELEQGTESISSEENLFALTNENLAKDVEPISSDENDSNKIKLKDTESVSSDENDSNKIKLKDTESVSSDDIQVSNLKDTDPVSSDDNNERSKLEVVPSINNDKVVLILEQVDLTGSNDIIDEKHNDSNRLDLTEAEHILINNVELKKTEETAEYKEDDKSIKIEQIDENDTESKEDDNSIKIEQIDENDTESFENKDNLSCKNDTNTCNLANVDENTSVLVEGSNLTDKTSTDEYDYEIKKEITFLNIEKDILADGAITIKPLKKAAKLLTKADKLKKQRIIILRKKKLENKKDDNLAEENKAKLSAVEKSEPSVKEKKCKSEIEENKTDSQTGNNEKTKENETLPVIDKIKSETVGDSETLSAGECKDKIIKVNTTEDLIAEKKQFKLNIMAKEDKLRQNKQKSTSNRHKIKVKIPTDESKSKNLKKEIKTEYSGKNNKEKILTKVCSTKESKESKTSSKQINTIIKSSSQKKNKNSGSSVEGQRIIYKKTMSDIIKEKVMSKGNEQVSIKSSIECISPMVQNTNSRYVKAKRPIDKKRIVSILNSQAQPTTSTHLPPSIAYPPPGNPNWTYRAPAPWGWTGAPNIPPPLQGYNDWNNKNMQRASPLQVDYSRSVSDQVANYPRESNYKNSDEKQPSVNYRSPPRKIYRSDRSRSRSPDRYSSRSHNVGRYPRSHDSVSKRSSSRRSSPTRRYSRSRTPSPRKRSSRKSVEEVALQSLREVHDKECDMYRKNPEAHPDYSKEKRAWFDKMSVSHGYTADSYFLQEKWKSTWLSLIEDNFKKHWNEKKNKCLSLLPGGKRSRSRCRSRERSSKRSKVEKQERKHSPRYSTSSSYSSSSSYPLQSAPCFDSIDALEKRINEYIKKSSTSFSVDSVYPQSKFSDVTAFPSTSRGKSISINQPVMHELAANKTPNVLEVTSVLSEISDRFGNLGSFIRSLHDQLTRDNMMKKNLIDALMDDDALLLLKMVSDQLSHFLGDATTSIVQKAIYMEAQEKLGNLLKTIKSSKKPFTPLQLESIRNLTRGMDMMQTLKLIKENLKLKERFEPADQEVMDVYIALKASENDKPPLPGSTAPFSGLLSNPYSSNQSNQSSGFYGILPTKPESKIDRIKNDFKNMNNVQKLEKFKNFGSLAFEEKSVLLSYLDETDISNPHFAQVLRMMINERRS